MSQSPAPLTPLILTTTVGILPSASVLVEDLIKATLREASTNLLKVTPKFIGWKATNESTHSCDANQLSGLKDSTVPSTSCGAPGTGSNATGSCDPKQEVAHLTMVVSDDDEFADDPHQITHTTDVFTAPAFQEMILMESMKGTFCQQQ